MIGRCGLMTIRSGQCGSCGKRAEGRGLVDLTLGEDREGCRTAGMTTRLGGLAAVAGGIFWVAAAWFAALSPPYGSAGNFENRFATEDAWMLAALPLIAMGALTLDRMHRDHTAKAARVGTALFVAGAMVASVSLALEGLSIFVMQRPVFQIGAQVLLIPVGGLLLGFGSFRARVIPSVVASMLLIGAGLLFIANSENWMAGLAAVFGLGWVAAGVVMATSSAGREAAPAV